MDWEFNQKYINIKIKMGYLKRLEVINTSQEVL